MARKHNIIVVGAGLFGSIAARLARAEGHTVTVVSNQHPEMASKASGCVLAPSWLTSLSKEDIGTAMHVLASLATVHDMEFKTHLGKVFRAQRVSTPDLLVEPDLIGVVTNAGNGVVAGFQPGNSASFKLKGKVLIAAGFWSDKLVADMPKMRGMYGASVVFGPTQLKQPTLRMWAPYKQAVGFNLNSKSVWFGDGTALSAPTWAKRGAEAIARTIGHGVDMLAADHRLGAEERKMLARYAHVAVGVRPYVEGYKAGYFEKIGKDTWVSTGGAKNGTVLAALYAHRFLRSLL